MRIHWDEKAKRLAEKYDLGTYDSYLEIRLVQDNGIEQMGIKTNDGRQIMWYLKGNWIYCEVKENE